MSTKNNKKTGRVFGVSLGPGPADLVTVRALAVLRSVDKIYFPVRSDSVKREKSRSLSILKSHGLSENAEPLPIEMRRRDLADLSYESARDSVTCDIERGLNVAVVCEGCISLYSTAYRLLGGGFGAPVEMVPGVSSPMAAAAAAGVSLGLGNDTIALVSGAIDYGEMEKLVDDFDTVVFMKPVAADAVIRLAENGRLRCFYCSDIGGDEQIVSCDMDGINADDIEYFSLFIASKRPQRCPER